MLEYEIADEKARKEQEWKEVESPEYIYALLMDVWMEGLTEDQFLGKEELPEGYKW